jgi:hypothetical protein
MVVRIDTTNVTRGQDFSIFAKNYIDQSVEIYALNPISGEVVSLQHTQTEIANSFVRFDLVAPSFDGYLMAAIGNQKIVKKIGHPMLHFVIGHKAGFTIPFKAYDGYGEVISDSNLINAVGGFYYTPLSLDTAVVTALNKEFIINKDLLKLNYEITMDGGELNSTFEASQIDDATLQDITLPDAELGSVDLGSTMPNITIRET